MTSQGRPVARIVPASEDAALPSAARASGARATLLSRLERQPPVETGRWTRGDLYETER